MPTSCQAITLSSYLSCRAAASAAESLRPSAGYRCPRVASTLKRCAREGGALSLYAACENPQVSACVVFYGVADRHEVIICQHNIGSLAGDIGA